MRIASHTTNIGDAHQGTTNRGHRPIKGWIMVTVDKSHSHPHQQPPNFAEPPGWTPCTNSPAGSTSRNLSKRRQSKMNQLPILLHLTEDMPAHKPRTIGVLEVQTPPPSKSQPNQKVSSGLDQSSATTLSNTAS